jgi:hypothetical protein
MELLGEEEYNLHVMCSSGEGNSSNKKQNILNFIGLLKSR